MLAAMATPTSPVSTRGELVARLFVDHYQVAGSLTDPRRQRP
jgi:hypothetical protein